MTQFHKKPTTPTHAHYETNNFINILHQKWKSNHYTNNSTAKKIEREKLNKKT